MSFIDLTGKRFGRLTVIGRADDYSVKSEYSFDRKITWRCLCDCGVECVVIGANLKRGATRSCGCLRRDLLLERAARKRQAKVEEGRC